MASLIINLLCRLKVKVKVKGPIPANELRGPELIPELSHQPAASCMTKTDSEVAWLFYQYRGYLRSFVLHCYSFHS